MDRVISIGGQLANGKDVLADYLAEKLGWSRIAFADAVKKVFMDTFDVDRIFIEKWKRNPEPPPGYLKNIRQSLQFIGDGFRTIRPEIWLETAFRQPGDKIISDARYLNEVEFTKKQGGVTILVWRPGYENDDPNLSEAQIRPVVDYFSEAGVEGQIWPIDTPKREAHEHMRGKGPELFDLFIINDGSLEDLYQTADNLIIPYIEAHYND
jgi:hypothetical protein